MSFTLSVAVLPSDQASLAYTNRVFVSKRSFGELARAALTLGAVISRDDPTVNVRINSIVFLAAPQEFAPDGQVMTTKAQREGPAQLALREYECAVFVPGAEVALTSIVLGVDFLTVKAGQTETKVEASELSDMFRKMFSLQVYQVGMKLVLNYKGITLALKIEGLEHADFAGGAGGGGGGAGGGRLAEGQVLSSTHLKWKKAAGSTSPLRLMGVEQELRNDSMFKSDFDFEKMGIGGLGREFQTMLRKAFATRLFPGITSKMGMKHVRGMLLYGPPGCGKTLIARQIGKVLNAREPKIVNGPELFDKYVGGSEEKVRALFADAEKEQKEAGDQSMLHIIILDEMDAIMRARGSTNDSTGTQGNVVNQFLSKIDGVDSLNNILLIGMTNRKDIIDPAILRPGRLEVHIEIPLPDKAGREQILRIKTLKMKETGTITPECIQRLGELAGMIENFTGAEIEAFVESAAKYVLARNIDGSKAGAKADKLDDVVQWGDFMRALENADVQPQFGNKTELNLPQFFRNGIVDYGISFTAAKSTLDRLLNQVRLSAKTPVLSVLLEGPTQTGKTALAASVAHQSGFPYVRMISADQFIGMGESQKCEKIYNTFVDAYKSPLSLVFIDDIERLIEYVPVGPRFSAAVLQTLLVMIKKAPTVETSRILILATTAVSHLIEDLGLTKAFSVSLQVPSLTDKAELRKALGGLLLSPGEVAAIAESIKEPIGIKQLLDVAEMARSEAVREGGEGASISSGLFLECLHVRGF